jgi:hypothetical protein
MPLTSNLIDANTHKNPKPIFATDQLRLLFLDSHEGSVACRVHGELTSGTMMHLSEEKTIECATRSLLRMNNLSAVRGKRGSSMVGPADYYGNLEKPHEKLYSIKITDGKPMMYQHPLNNHTGEHILKAAIDESNITSVNATWTSHNDIAIDEKKRLYTHDNKPVFGNSIFPDSGILEIDDSPAIELTLFDARGVDLSSFKARLVANDEPFKITQEELSAADEYRAISYLYESGYAQDQVENSGGMFLEKHSFAQTMTPLDQSSGGFVTLARQNEASGSLEIIAFKIPYGYTLIVEEYCIHGDATLSGMYMMCMTSNHTTMQTADSVFLKSTTSKENVVFNITNPDVEEFNTSAPAPPPFVLYKDDDEHAMNHFLQTTKDMSFIFNPFSSGFWKRGIALFNESGLSMKILGGFIAAVGITAVILGFAALNVVTLGVPSGCLLGIGVATTIAGIGIFSKSSSSSREKPDNEPSLPDLGEYSYA